MDDGLLTIFTAGERRGACDAALGELRSRLVSVERDALRGVGRPQDLYTLE